MGLVTALTLKGGRWFSALRMEAYQRLPKPFAELPILSQLETVGEEVFGTVETAHLGRNVDPEVFAPLRESVHGGDGRDERLGGCADGGF